MPSICIINSLSIREGMYHKTFQFKNGLNLIQSNGKNSVGKTTLMRSLLYALGEPVAGTIQFKFAKHEFRVALQVGDRSIVGLRSGNKYRIDYEGLGCDIFVLPYQLNEIRKAIWGFQSEQVLANYLGAMFIDQDKGWSLLNRGKVTSDIGFNIE